MSQAQTFVAFLACVLLASCGGGSGQVEEALGNETPDPRPAHAAIVFPPPGPSMTDAGAATVRGTASDPDGIAQVRVGGVPADSDDDFATWRASVPLDLGDNHLVVEVEDHQGHVTTAGSVSIERRDLAGRVWSVAVDPDEDRLFLLDTELGTVRALDLATGIEQVINPSFDAVPLSGSGAKELVFDPNRDRFYATAGAHVVAQGVNSTSMTWFEAPTNGALDSIAFDAVNDLVWIATGRILWRMDPVTGNRTVVADATTGSGPELRGVTELIADPLRGRLFVYDHELEAVLSVDMITGNRTQITSGPGLDVQGLAFDATTEALYAAVQGDGLFSSFVRIGLDGSVTPLPDDTTAHAPIGQVWDLAFHGGHLLALEISSQRVSRVHSSTGARSRAWPSPVGSGSETFVPYGLDTQLASTSFYVADLNRVLALDVPTGTRSVVSGDLRGSGPPLRAPTGIVQRGDDLLVLDPLAEALFRIDRISGDRYELLGPTSGTGPSLGGATRLLEHDGRLFTFNADSLLELDVDGNQVRVIRDLSFATPRRPLDLASGPTGIVLLLEREVYVCDPDTGDVEPVAEMDDTSVRTICARRIPASGELLIGGEGGLIALNLVTGAQRRVADEGIGRGPVPFAIGMWIDQSAGLAWLAVRDGLQVVDLQTLDRMVRVR